MSVVMLVYIVPSIYLYILVQIVKTLKLLD